MTDSSMKCRSPQFDPIFGSTRFTVGAFGNTSRKAVYRLQFLGHRVEPYAALATG